MSQYMDFKLKRDSIVGQKHLDVMNGVSFTDAKLVARSSARKLEELAVAVDILNAASEGLIFEKYYCDTSPCLDDGYDDEDSDLELDEDDDEPAVVDRTKSQSIVPKVENTHSDVFESHVATPEPPPSTPAAVNEEGPPPSDDDFDVNVTFSDVSSQPSCFSHDDYEEAIVTPSPKRSPSLHNPKPRSIGLALDDHVKITVPGAHKTWKALYFFLLTDHLKFAPLRSNLVAATNEEAESKYKDLPSCSPKSMYRLADRFGFVEAKRLAFSKFKSCLDEDNIVQELFSDFTWRGARSCIGLLQEISWPSKG
ncbi:hypothetical protein C8Q75DRAFT_170861 [Abortiporus biennis]|nr:hypothetical protein C8Q75DRAFT_170861 [Abortiporus biennis]